MKQKTPLEHSQETSERFIQLYWCVKEQYDAHPILFDNASGRVYSQKKTLNVHLFSELLGMNYHTVYRWMKQLRNPSYCILQYAEERIQKLGFHLPE